MLLTLSVLLPALGIWLLQTTKVRQSDLDHYEEMIQERKIAASQTPTSTRQHRKEVTKDIWFTQDDCSRLHYQIASEGSLLTLTPVGNKFEFVESLQGIRCWMQDQLLQEEEPAQQARYFEADEGVYRYSTQEFVANDVSLSLFHLPGHKLPEGTVDPEEAFFKGRAKDISFFFGGNTPQFQARQFQAIMSKEEQSEVGL